MSTAPNWLNNILFDEEPIWGRGSKWLCHQNIIPCIISPTWVFRRKQKGSRKNVLVSQVNTELLLLNFCCKDLCLWLQFFITVFVVLNIMHICTLRIKLGSLINGLRKFIAYFSKLPCVITLLWSIYTWSLQVSSYNRRRIALEISSTTSSSTRTTGSNNVVNKDYFYTSETPDNQLEQSHSAQQRTPHFHMNC